MNLIKPRNHREVRAVADKVRRVEYFYATLPDKPGEGFRILSALKDAGVLLLAAHAFPTGGGQSQLDLVAEDASKLKQAAQAARKTILIEVSASWCSTCKRQRPILQNAEKERPGLVVFDVDFDSAKDVLRRFGVRHPSTLVVFNGTTEVGRSTGDTDPVSIRALIAKGF